MPLGSLTMQFIDSLQGVKDCPITGTKLPLVIISHGRGGWFGGHNDVAEALADAGFVVAAINHPGDNGNDRSQSDSLSVMASRPADIIRLLDFMVNNWKDKAALDPNRIGFFGFSKGATQGWCSAAPRSISRGLQPTVPTTRNFARRSAAATFHVTCLATVGSRQPCSPTPQ